MSDERANCTTCGHSLDAHLGVPRWGELPCGTCDCRIYEPPVTPQGVAGVIWTFLARLAPSTGQDTGEREPTITDEQAAERLYSAPVEVQRRYLLDAEFHAEVYATWRALQAHGTNFWIDTVATVLAAARPVAASREDDDERA